VSGNFDAVWFSAILFGGGGYLAVQGLRVAIRRRVENPLLDVQGGRALAVGLAVFAIGVAAAAFAARELLKLQGGG
jgi:hypothetical protein